MSKPRNETVYQRTLQHPSRIDSAIKLHVERWKARGKRADEVSLTVVYGRDMDDNVVTFLSPYEARQLGEALIKAGSGS